GEGGARVGAEELVLVAEAVEVERAVGSGEDVGGLGEGVVGEAADGLAAVEVDDLAGAGRAVGDELGEVDRAAVAVEAEFAWERVGERPGEVHAAGGVDGDEAAEPGLGGVSGDGERGVVERFKL